MSRRQQLSVQVRDRAPYKSLICEMIHVAVRDAQEGQEIDWADLPFVESVDVSIPRIKHKLN